MSTQTLLLVILAAVLFFWAVGAHNRLVRLSNAVAAEHEPIDAHLRARAQLFEQWLALADLLQPEERAPLEQSLEALRSALGALRQRPSSARELHRLIDAGQRCERERAALCALPQVQQLAAVDPGWRQAMSQLQELDERFAALAQAHRASVQQFNEAVCEFPALLVARMVGLKPLPDLLEPLELVEPGRAQS
ncbi:MAG: LemA family protein [Betaproteobacteria bacterium]